MPWALQPVVRGKVQGLRVRVSKRKHCNPGRVFEASHRATFSPGARTAVLLLRPAFPPHPPCGAGDRLGVPHRIQYITPQSGLRESAGTAGKWLRFGFLAAWPLSRPM